LSDVISKAAFARSVGVSTARVSQWLSDGVIGPEALLGKGRHARIRADLAKSMLRDRLDPERRTANLDGLSREVPADHPKSEFTAARARTASLQGQLLELRVSRERGATIPRSEAIALGGPCNGHTGPSPHGQRNSPLRRSLVAAWRRFLAFCGRKRRSWVIASRI
jgi:hypothetical protein